ncbi:hypothetical protein [Bhargavaea cecembensis]|uniref:hypothetical protein n=1 Tax=Bhargavaea cecembensis TaxID=394098 RepID=UPI0005910D3C|nr:hypothetical protein [Bhargavaea cecembensis]
MDQTRISELEREVEELRNTVRRLEKEMEEAEYLATTSPWAGLDMKAVGSFLLGAIVLIGIFWL